MALGPGPKTAAESVSITPATDTVPWTVQFPGASTAGTPSYTTTASSPYTVPAGRRVTLLSFVAAAGGGMVQINSGDPIELDEGDGLNRNFPLSEPARWKAGDIFEWTGIDRFIIEMWEAS